MKNEDEKIRISKSSFREWLEKLQQESWQLELLISGFALFAIWEARVLVDGYENYLTINRGGGGQWTGIILGSFSWLLRIGWRIFFFNLLIHVLARGLWIGAIGLRYVSADIDYDYFNYADNFTNFLKKNVGDFDDYIERLERFSSVIFAYTFLLFFIFLSLILYNIEAFALFNLFEDNREIGIFIILFFGFLGLIALIDFITMGGIKKIKEKHIARGYFIFYRIFSVMTLSFLYRPLLYNFWDEKYTRRLFLISIPYIFLLTYLSKISAVAYPHFPLHQHYQIQEKITYEYHYYDDERALAETRKKGIFRKKHPILGISLPSIELKGNYGWFFLRTYPKDANWLKKEKQLTPYRESGLVVDGWTDEVQDTLLNNLEEQRSTASTALIAQRVDLRRKIKNKEIEQLDAGLLEESGQFIIDEAYWKTKEDSLNRYWWDKKQEYKLDKLKKLNNSLLELATIEIDNIPYNDSCECKFYIHPNLGEKGLRCYFPMKNLAEGSHLLYLSRKEFYGNEEHIREAFYDHHVPFYKINKDF